MPALATSDGAVQARPLAGVAAQGTAAGSTRVLLGVRSADTAAVAPRVPRGPEPLRGRVVTASLETDLQGQNSCTATDRGESPCVQNEVCKEAITNPERREVFAAARRAPRGSPAASPRQQQPPALSVGACSVCLAGAGGSRSSSPHRSCRAAQTLRKVLALVNGWEVRAREGACLQNAFSSFSVSGYHLRNRAVRNK